MVEWYDSKFLSSLSERLDSCFGGTMVDKRRFCAQYLGTNPSEFTRLADSIYSALMKGGSSTMQSLICGYEEDEQKRSLVVLQEYADRFSVKLPNQKEGIMMTEWLSPNQERIVCAMLNSSSAGVAGWDDFAYHLGFSGNNRLLFKGTDNPFAAVISAWRHNDPRGVTTTKLCTILKKIGRNDVLHFLSEKNGKSIFSLDMKGRSRQEWGQMCSKLFRDASPTVINDLVVAFGLPNRCIGQSRVEFLAELECQMIMGPNYDMTNALNVFRSVYPAGANILAEYMGVAAAAAAPSAVQANAAPIDPFAAVLAQQAILNVNNFMSNPEFESYRTAILLQMDRSQGWVQFMRNRNLLGTPDMEKWVANLKTEWEQTHRGAPTLTVFTKLSQRDPNFGSTELSKFAQELIKLNIPSVTEEVVLLTSWIDSKREKSVKASETAYSAQSDLRSWLLKHGICDATDVDSFIPALRNAGVKTIDDIAELDRGELKECGFKPVQTSKIIKALQK